MTAMPNPKTRSRRQRREGAAAVEFGMVAAPFFFMLFAIMELGLIFVTDSVLENAVLETGRLVRTGEAWDSGMTGATFKEQLCQRMSVFEGDCGDRASVDVRVITQFRNPAPPDPLQDPANFDEDALMYQQADAGQLVLVRVWYRQPVFSPFLRQALVRTGDGNAMMVSTTSFRNEPFRTPTGAP